MPKDLVSIPGRATEFSPQCPDRPWRTVHGALSWQLKWPYVKSTIHLHLVWKLRICGAIPPIIHVPSWSRTGTHLSIFPDYLLLLLLVFSPWASWAGTRAQSGDRYGSGTLHPGQFLRGCLPLLIAYWIIKSTDTDSQNVLLLPFF